MTEPQHVYTADEIAREIREYVALIAQQGYDGMLAQLSQHPGAAEMFAERLIGYHDAVEDMIKVFTDPEHRVYRRVAVVAKQAQRLK